MQLFNIITTINF